MSTTAHYLNTPRGSRHYAAKLDENTVREIRAETEKRRQLLAQIRDTLSNAAIARRYRVSKSTVDQIATFARWRHVL